MTVISISLSALITLPMGFISPKYFFAIFSVITIEKALFKAFLGSPLIKGKVKISNTVSSAKTISSS